MRDKFVSSPGNLEDPDGLELIEKRRSAKFYRSMTLQKPVQAQMFKKFLLFNTFKFTHFWLMLHT